MSRDPATHRDSEPRIHRLAFQRQYTEHAFVHAAQRLAPNESLERFDAECELAQRQRPLCGETALPETIQVLRKGVLRTIDDPEIIPPATCGRADSDSHKQGCEHP